MAITVAPDPLYLLCRTERSGADRFVFRNSVLSAGMRAAVITTNRVVSHRTLNQLLDMLTTAFREDAKVSQVGSALGELLVDPDIASVLAVSRDRHLVIIHDAASARIPWEIVEVAGWRPAESAGLSHRFITETLPLATWADSQRSDSILHILLVVNPLGDLLGAEREGDRIRKLAMSTSSVKITELRGREATRAAILASVQSGNYDVLHYAGHAFFDPERPAESGFVVSGREVLHGSDLRGMSGLPSLIFFNLSEAGRVRGRGSAPISLRSDFERLPGLAESLALAGVANFLGTYWPLSDEAASAFSARFYGSILEGRTLGDSVQEARRAVVETGSRDWAAYALHGSSNFVIKQAR